MILKSNEEIEKIRQAGRILATCAKAILAQVEIGTNLKSLDKLARELIMKSGGRPAFLGYQPYGADRPYAFSICASLNDVVVHGTPKNYELKNGDILKLDFGVDYQGYKADAAWTVGVGQISEKAQKLMKVTEKALFDGIKMANIGKHLGDIGYAISQTVRQHGFSVVDGLTGHGIGKDLHEDPSVFNEGKKGSGPVLKQGLVIAIEPMVSAGSPSIVQIKDESYATADGSLAAHFEHTIALTENGTEILTLI